jgi:thiamine biosynthesis lipoprotein
MDSSKYGENGWDEFVWILEQSKIIHDLTGGAFDITVKPLLDLYSGDKPPSDDTINETLELVNIENLTIDDDHVEIKNEMSITLDGIAKGYGVDKASEILTEEGFEDHLVNIGGEVRCSGLDKGGKWVVGIADPSDPEKAYRKIHVSDISIATSGNYLQRHIIDPRNGSVVESNVKSVTVLGENCTWCDGLATAIFVLGANGLELINSKDLEELECLIITDSGCIASRGFEGIVG